MFPVSPLVDAAATHIRPLVDAGATRKWPLVDGDGDAKFTHFRQIGPLVDAGATPGFPVSPLVDVALQGRQATATSNGQKSNGPI